MEELSMTGIVKSTDELKKLILENPELPLVVLAGENACDYDCSSCFCSVVRAYIGELLDCEQEVEPEHLFDDRINFEELLFDYISDKNPDKNEAEVDEIYSIELKKYEKYWKKCIILYVDN